MIDLIVAVSFLVLALVMVFALDGYRGE